MDRPGTPHKTLIRYVTVKLWMTTKTAQRPARSSTLYQTSYVFADDSVIIADANTGTNDLSRPLYRAEFVLQTPGSAAL